ncbi:MAG: hypothetical protein ACKOQ3_12270 [Novosphingobium sp.]
MTGKSHGFMVRDGAAGAGLDSRPKGRAAPSAPLRAKAGSEILPAIEVKSLPRSGAGKRHAPITVSEVEARHLRQIVGALANGTTPARRRITLFALNRLFALPAAILAQLRQRRGQSTDMSR